MNSFQFMFNCLIADIMTPPLLTNIILIIAFGGCILKKHFFIFLYFYNDLTVIFFSLSPLSLFLFLSLSLSLSYLIKYSRLSEMLYPEKVKTIYK